jgi:hypothetical protein
MIFAHLSAFSIATNYSRFALLPLSLSLFLACARRNWRENVSPGLGADAALGGKALGRRPAVANRIEGGL